MQQLSILYHADCVGEISTPLYVLQRPRPPVHVRAAAGRQDREALAQLRTGSHWGAEETGRWTRRPREQRVCPHCHDGIEDAPHMLLTCPLYAPLRLNFPDLFAEPHPPHRFLRQKPCRLAAFAAACHQRWLTATVALPAVPP